MAETGIVAKRYPQSNTILARLTPFAYPLAVLLKTAKRVIVFVIGMTAVVFGVVLLAPPGPGSLVIFAGLAILATEFVWARRLLRKARSVVDDGRKKGWREGWKTLMGAFRRHKPPDRDQDTTPSDSSN